MSGLQKFEIQLDSPDHTFSPGEVIAGRVIVNLNRPKSIRGLKVKIKGKAQVSWSDTTGTGRDRKTVEFTGDEEYFRMEFYVLGQGGSGENVEIQSGSHIFPFNFCLPRNIPSSFETSHGSIRYTIKAVMDRPWKFDHETSIAFSVETPYDLSQHTGAMSTIDDEESATFCCFSCFNVGSMKVHVFLPSNGFAIGEAIQVKITVDNTSASVDVEKIKLKLEQKIKLFARFPHSSTKKLTNIVQGVKKDGPFSKKDEILVSMQVPSLPYSNMAFCSLIDIEYKIKIVVAVSGCHCDTEKEYPIVIGSRPVINVQPTQSPMMVTAPIPNAPMPTAPYFPTETPMPMGTAMPPVSMPMPTMPMGPTSPAGPMPMPMPMPIPTMPMPYPPPQSEQLPGKPGGEYNAPAPGFASPMPSYGYGNQPYPPAMPPGPGALGFVAPGPAQAMPPSYNEAMGMNAKH